MEERCINNYTSLHHALTAWSDFETGSVQERTEVAKALIERGADVVALQGRDPSVGLLAGAFTLVTYTDDPKTNVSYAVLNREVLQMILGRGAPLVWKDGTSNDEDDHALLLTSANYLSPDDVAWWLDAMQERGVDLGAVRYDGKNYMHMVLDMDTINHDIAGHLDVLEKRGLLDFSTIKKNVLHMIVRRSQWWPEYLDALIDRETYLPLVHEKDSKGLDLRDHLVMERERAVEDGDEGLAEAAAAWIARIDQMVIGAEMDEAADRAGSKFTRKM